MLCYVNGVGDGGDGGDGEEEKEVVYLVGQLNQRWAG